MSRLFQLGILLILLFAEGCSNRIVSITPIRQAYRLSDDGSYMITGFEEGALEMKVCIGSFTADTLFGEVVSKKSKEILPTASLYTAKSDPEKSIFNKVCHLSLDT